MRTLRLIAAACIGAALAACGGGTTNTTPVSIPTATPSAAASSSTFSPSANAQSLPVANGATASVTLPVAAGTSGTVTVTASATAPAGFAQISAFRRSAQAVTRNALAYYAFVPSVDIVLTGFPTFTIAFPANIVPVGSTIHEGFLDGSTSQPVWSYDIAVGASGATFSATASAPKLLAGKSYIFVFYLESGSNATPTPSPAPTSSPSAMPTATATPTAAPTTVAAGEITVPPSISSLPPGISYSTDGAIFSGLAGTHFFGNGGKAPSNLDNPTAITDCNLTISGSNVTLSGGGGSETATFVSANPSVKTLLVANADPLNLGGIETLTFYDATGGGINVVIEGGRVIGAAGGHTGTFIACTTSYAVNVFTDRSLDTAKLSPATIAALNTRAGSTNPYTASNVTAADFGNASGTVNFGRGVISTLSGTNTIVSDCRATISGNTVTLSGGSFSNSATFSGASTDHIFVLAVQASPTEYALQPENSKVLLLFNNFGFAYKAQSTSNGSTLACPV
jgi:hypothetical protein